MIKYQVGMRVKILMPYDGNELIVNEIAIIKSISGNRETGILHLEFAKNIGGHRCGGLTRNGHGWDMRISKSEKYLQLAEGFKVGDKVRCITGISKGSKGDIIHIGKWKGNGDKNSVWAYWDKEKYLSYLDKDILIKVEKK